MRPFQTFQTKMQQAITQFDIQKVQKTFSDFSRTTKIRNNSVLTYVLTKWMKESFTMSEAEKVVAILLVLIDRENAETINTPSSDGWSNLIMALALYLPSDKSFTILTAMINKGADVNLVCNNTTPISMYVWMTIKQNWWIHMPTVTLLLTETNAKETTTLRALQSLKEPRNHESDEPISLLWLCCHLHSQNMNLPLKELKKLNVKFGPLERNVMMSVFSEKNISLLTDQEACDRFDILVSYGCHVPVQLAYNIMLQKTVRVKLLKKIITYLRTKRDEDIDLSSVLRKCISVVRDDPNNIQTAKMAINLLVSLGAQLDKKDTSGNDALDQAITSNNSQIAYHIAHLFTQNPKRKINNYLTRPSINDVMKATLIRLKQEFQTQQSFSRHRTRHPLFPSGQYNK